MENERYQKELFEFEAPKKQKSRFGQLFQKTDFIITLTAEKLVFIGIAIIMLFVVSFALGVEKGKSVSRQDISVESKEAVSVKAPAQTAVAQVQARALPTVNAQNKTTIAKTNITPKDKMASAVEPQKMQVLADKNKPYTIVAATFKRQDFAASEVSRLKKAGMEAFVYYSEPYYLACIGSFVSKDSALKSLGKARQMHRDAYVRLK